jgi:PAS domain-containing protein
MLIHNPFLKIIADTCTPLSPDKSHFEVLLEGLEGFLQFPDCKEASLFLLDSATFDFYLKLVVPWRDEISLKTEFDALAESGIIGDVLTTGKMQPARTSKEEGGFHSLVVPLIASSVYGLVVIRMTKIPPMSDPFFSALQIYAHQYVLRLMVSQQSTAIQNLEENMKQMASVSSSHLTDTDIEVLEFLDKFPIGIFLVRKTDGIILSVNTAAAIALGTAKENIVNQRIDEFLFKAGL